MKVRHIRTLDGPNLFHHRPVLLMLLDLGNLHKRSSDSLPGFVGRLLQTLPGLHSHRCSVGRVGGFVQRLRDGTYLGHVVEHVALELSGPAGIGVSYGKTVATAESGVYQVAVRYRCEPAMRYLIHSAVALVDALIEGRSVAVETIVAEAKRIAERHALGPSTRSIVDAARVRGIPWRRIGATGGLIRLGWGKNIRWTKTAVSDTTSLIAAENAQNKELTKQLLQEAQIAVPRGAIADNVGDALAAMHSLTKPVVIKPQGGNHGRGCTLGVTTPEAASAAFENAAKVSRTVLIEEQIEGDDHRIVVVNGKVVAASRRVPAQVMGNGVLTIAQLIEQENTNPLRGIGHAKPLTRIVVDGAVRAVLAARGLSIESIPADGMQVRLRETANLSTGGTAADVTDEVHPDVAALCVRAAGAVGLDIAGIDFISPDITQGKVGAIIEINAGPGLRMHHYPSAGKARDVGGAIVEMLYPVNSDGRIPLVAITGTNGKTTVARMVSHIVGGTGKTVGIACTDGVWIGEQQIVSGDSAGPNSARLLLADRSVEVAVVEAARGGIMRRGLGYDWSDVGVVTNVHEDHIGQDGIRSVKDLVRIKALVAARVRAGGTLVLNADNEPALSMMRLAAVRRVGKRIVYFSPNADSARMRRHLERGHSAYVVRDGCIVEARGLTSQQAVVALADIPATLGGLARFNVCNALAATAASRALGVSIEQIAEGLTTFEHAAANHGRANLYQVRGGYVLVDYGHNAHAYEAIGGLLGQLQGYRKIGVIDMPGDRADVVIEQGARAAGQVFDRVILHKPHNARGRQPGDVARLICEEILRSAPHCQCTMENDEPSAVAAALSNIGPGQFVVLFYERFECVWQALERQGAVRAYSVTPLVEGARDRAPAHRESVGSECLNAA